MHTRSFPNVERQKVWAMLADHGITPSTGSVGDSYDNALAESVNGLYKTELIYSQPWAGLAEVEFARLS